MSPPRPPASVLRADTDAVWTVWVAHDLNHVTFESIVLCLGCHGDNGLTMDERWINGGSTMDQRWINNNIQCVTYTKIVLLVTVLNGI